MKHFLLTVFLTVGVFGCSSGSSEPFLTLKNGSPLFILKEPLEPRQAVSVYFQTGAFALKEPQPGLSSLLARVFYEGPKGMTRAEYDQKRFMESFNVGFAAGTGHFEVTVWAFPKDLEEKLKFVRHLLDNPKFDDETFATVHARYVNGRKLSFEDPETILDHFETKDFFKGHRLFPATPTPKQAESYKLSDVVKAKDILLNSKHALFISYGPMKQADVQKIVEKVFYTGSKSFAKFERRILPETDVEMFARPGRVAKVLHKPGLVNHQVSLIVPQLRPIDKPEGLPHVLTTRILGGGAFGQLAKVLREQRGLTYTAHAFHQEHYWQIQSFADSNKIDKLIPGIFEMVRDFPTKYLEEERFQSAKDAQVLSYKSTRELVSDQVRDLMWQYDQNRDFQFYRDYIKHVKTLTFDQIQNFATNRLNPDKGVLYLYGDKAAILPALKEAGYQEHEIEVVNFSDIL